MSNEKNFRQDISTRQEIEAFKKTWSRMEELIGKREKMLNEKIFKKEFPLLPKQDDLRKAILDQPRYLDLSIKTPAIELFKKHLLKTPIFKEDQYGKVQLVDPRSDRSVPGMAYGRLLNSLSNELFNFFYKAKNEGKNQYVTWDHLVYTLRYLAATEPWLITYDIVSEEIFDSVIRRIYGWLEKYDKNSMVNTKIRPKRTAKRAELVDSLYTLFHESSRLADEGIFLCIALILEYLGMEEGGTKQIANRVKIAFYRRRKPFRSD